MKERNHFKEVDIDGTVLKWILNKFDGMAWTGLIWLRIGAYDGLW
jgi:hypothetical protein